MQMIYANNVKVLNQQRNIMESISFPKQLQWYCIWLNWYWLIFWYLDMDVNVKIDVYAHVLPKFPVNRKKCVQADELNVMERLDVCHAACLK